MRFWTADMHLDHKNIPVYCPDRPGNSIDEMNQILINNWNSVVGPEDEVILVGDLAMGKVHHSVPLSAQLNGHKAICPGNHDRMWSGLPDKPELTQLYVDAGWEILPEQFETEIGGRTVLVCHFPYSGDSHDEDRYLDHRPVDTGLPLIHGHVHNEWKVRDRMINVGCDVWSYHPVSELGLIDLMDRMGL